MIRISKYITFMLGMALLAASLQGCSGGSSSSSGGGAVSGVATPSKVSVVNTN